MSQQTERVRRRYNRNAAIYDLIDRSISGKQRRELLQYARGEILEVGVGTGANLPYYPKGVRVTGIDLSPGMLKKAKERMVTLAGDTDIHLEEMDVEELPFADKTFDTIVTSCVYCSVPDPVKGMKEMRRVLKDDGEILMLEHMRSENPVIGFGMDLVNPVVRRLWGANINRDTMGNLEAAGLDVRAEVRVMGTIMRRLTVRKAGTS
ncbi:class I SAM-dependent methyltransferase [Salisediminibacterium selenitireducens]|uniref:Methyltransferase type 11 n=1 Tax=Bacillus selenitireducens (strain ATCC 700615 / DSM 15326 / MLS10) TaxID=439292 RepID=D6XY90_BACIE|nr:class I SAM-dependent methyltransferase [Salisediminibacterium selenitireducens]ADH98163.1 Methyltransferase type 11 [[Bacillus] selenitireducens MLS10]